MLDTAVDQVVLAGRGSPYLLEAELVLARNLTLEGEANATVEVDAQSSASQPRRVVSVVSGAWVELRSLHLTGGWTGKGSGIAGSAIGNDGNLLMVSCSVFGNVAYYGGGIFNRGELELHGCSLYDNAAANSGGALYSYPGTWLSIYWSSFYSNTALYGGGVDSHAFGVIVDSHLRNNTASAGGAGGLGCYGGAL